MKKIGLFIVILSIAVSCSPAAKTLYYWGGAQNTTVSMYETAMYSNFDKQTPETVCNLVCVYEDMVSNPGGQRKVIPPGICAEYAYLLALPETAKYFAETATRKQRKLFERDDYDLLFKEKSEELFEKELELYPESATFLQPIIKKMKDR